MLLARIAAELRINSGLYGELLPVQFMEESQEIFNLADFWLETLFHLARECSAHNAELSLQLRETHAALSLRWRDQSLEGQARAAVLDAVDRLGRKLVLMVENMQALNENVDKDFGWGLRQALQSESKIMLVATATSRFRGLDNAEQPFFELFRILTLETLDTDDCRRLWQVASGDAVSGRDIRPLQILTGGSPRLLVIIAGFAQHRSLRQLMEELITLVDDHTEYFRGHLDALGKTERRVYIAVIDLWQASKPGEIAARARMDVRIVSTMLGRLANRGAVIVEGSGKKRFYTAAERLYSIYYKLRRQRSEASVIENLIRFMAVFYNEAEQAEMFHQFLSEADDNPAIREALANASATLPKLDSLTIGAARPGVSKPEPDKNATSARHTAASTAGPAQPSETSEAWEGHIRKKIKAAFERGAFNDVIRIVDQTLLPDSRSLPQMSEELVAWALHKKADAHKELSDSESAIAAYEEVLERLGDSKEPNSQLWVAATLSDKGDSEQELGDLVSAIEAYEELVDRFGASDVPGLQNWVALTLVDMGDTRRELGDLEKAFAAYGEVVKRFGPSDVPELQFWVAAALVDMGDARKELCDWEEAITAYDKVNVRFGTSDEPELQRLLATALVNKASAWKKLGDWEQAIATYDEVNVRFGTSDEPVLQWSLASALINKAEAQTNLGDFEASIMTYRNMVKRYGASEEPDVVNLVALALIFSGFSTALLDKSEEAIVDFDEVVKRFGASNVAEHRGWVALALLGKGQTQARIGCLEDALRTYDTLKKKISSLTDKEQIRFAWRVNWSRAYLLIAQGEQGMAMDALRSAYDVFEPSREEMMDEMLRFAPDLIANGASPREVAEVLAGDNEKCETLQPLVVALRQEAGEEVRAPVEMLEVAADIRKRIKERAAT